MPTWKLVVSLGTVLVRRRRRGDGTECQTTATGAYRGSGAAAETYKVSDRRCAAAVGAFRVPRIALRITLRPTVRHAPSPGALGAPVRENPGAPGPPVCESPGALGAPVCVCVCVREREPRGSGTTGV